MPSWANTTRRRFEWSVEQLETALRMARAEAAASGRRIQLTFDAETGRPDVLWEPSPLGEPGLFSRHAACTWRLELPGDVLQAVSCQLIGPDGMPVLTDADAGGDETDDEEFQPITFYPDGTSDSAAIKLICREDEESFRAIVKLDGDNQLITTRLLYGPAEDDEDPFADAESQDAEADRE